MVRACTPLQCVSYTDRAGAASSAETRACCRAAVQPCATAGHPAAGVVRLAPAPPCVSFLGVSNYARTAVLMAAWLGVLLAIGHYLGGAQGMLTWGAIGLLFNFVAYWFSDRIALAVNRARPVSR